MVITRSTTREETEQKQVQFKSEFQRLASIDWSNTHDYKDIKFIVHRPFTFLMAEKLINTILSNDLDKWSKFSGKSDENVNKWIMDITNELNMVKLDDIQKRSVIQTFLLEDARRWFINHMTEMRDWSTFVACIQKAFSSNWIKESAIKKVGSRQRGMGETILHYYNEMVELFDTIDSKMADPLKVMYLTTGFKTIYQERSTTKQSNNTCRFSGNSASRGTIRHSCITTRSAR